jgi:hypothetical protein
MATQETKAQRVERLKREKNPLQCLDEIRSFAREGHASIPPEWLKTHFRWWGVCTQGDEASAIGGSSGEGRATPYFMVRNPGSPTGPYATAVLIRMKLSSPNTYCMNCCRPHAGVSVFRGVPSMN